MEAISGVLSFQTINVGLIYLFTFIMKNYNKRKRKLLSSFVQWHMSIIIKWEAGTCLFIWNANLISSNFYVTDFWEVANSFMNVLFDQIKEKTFVPDCCYLYPTKAGEKESNSE